MAKNLPVAFYVAFIFVGLIFWLVFLLIFIHYLPILVQTGARELVFFLILLFPPLVPSLVLLGLAHSYARVTHSEGMTKIQLGGGAALYALCVGAGLWLMLHSPHSIDLTVRAHSTDGSAPIINFGSVTLQAENFTRNEQIGSNGEANFKGLPATLNGVDCKFLPDVPGFERDPIVEKIDDSPIDLPLVKQPPPTTLLLGTVHPVPKGPKQVVVRVEGGSVEAAISERGDFQLKLPGSPGDRVRLQIFQGSSRLYDDYVTLPGPVTIALDSHRGRR